MTRFRIARSGRYVAALALVAAAAACAGGSPTEPQLASGSRKGSDVTALEGRPSIFSTAWEARPARMAGDIRSIATAWEARATDPVTQRAKVATGTFRAPVERARPTAFKVRR